MVSQEVSSQAKSGLRDIISLSQSQLLYLSSSPIKRKEWTEMHQETIVPMGKEGNTLHAKEVKWMFRRFGN